MRKIILIRGPIGAGKSTLVKILRDKVPDSSLVDMDNFKRAIDNTKTSEWRSQTAFDISLYMAKKIMESGRTIIADIHSAKEYQYEAYRKLASENDYELISFLLYPPLEICLERNRKRFIPEIKYQITDDTVRQYWEVIHNIEGESIFDNSTIDSEEIAHLMLQSILK